MKRIFVFALLMLFAANVFAIAIQNIKVTASSFGGAELTPEKTVDGDMTTRWSSAFEDNQWIIFDLGREYEVYGMKIFWDPSYAREYGILGSNDKTNWKLIKHVNSYGQETIAFGRTKFRYYKLDLIKRGSEWGYLIKSGTKWGFSIWECSFLNENEVKDSFKKNEPPWKGNRIGFSDEVLPPWTPITVAGEKVGVWGRTYQFGSLPFPSSVKSLEAEILDGPITFTGTINGKPLVWRGTASRVTGTKPNLVRLGSSANADGLRCEGAVSVEYDGMVRADFKLLPGNPKTSIENLTLEIPLKAEHALFLHTWPSYWGSIENSTALPRDGYRGPFKPFVWLGDHERGFCWFSESDRNFFNDQPDRVIEIVRDGDRAVLRVHLISGPHTIDQPLEYTFGFQATPVKPAQPDAWDYRSVHMGGYWSWMEPEFFNRLANCDVRTMSFHEYWNDIQNYTKVTYTSEMTRLVSDCHARNIQLLLYYGDQLSDIAPEWDRYHEECLVYPRALAYNRKEPKQTTYTVCNHSHWQDFMVEGIDQVMGQYGTDGVYLDQMSEPWGCANLRHGCGYQRPDGSIGLTYPIFSTRQALKRIYTVVKHRNPKGQVSVHQSSCMTIPTLAFATSYWDGEFVNASLRRSPNPLEILSLDTFCTEFMGRNWGVPAELLWWGDSSPFSRDKAMSIALLHDVNIRPCADEAVEMAGQLWKAFDAFGRHEADWLPYWTNSNVVRSQPSGVKVSLYNRPGRGLVAVVVNTGVQFCDAVVMFDLNNLKQPTNMIARDVFSEKKIPISAGRLQLPLGPMDHAVVWLKPEHPRTAAGNLLSNPGFEGVSAKKKIDGWRVAGGDVFEAWGEETHEGKRSLRFWWKGSCSQKVEAMPGMEYELSAWLCNSASEPLDPAGTKSAKLKIEFLNSDQQVISDASSDTFDRSQQIGKWREVKMRVRTPPDTEYVNVVLQMLAGEGGGVVLFDDVKLEQVKEAGERDAKNGAFGLTRMNDDAI